MAEPLKVSSLSWVQELYEAAKEADGQLTGPSARRLKAALFALERVVNTISTEKQNLIIELAKDFYDGEDITVDENGLIYHLGVEGYWVQAGVFVSDAAIEEALAASGDV